MSSRLITDCTLELQEKYHEWDYKMVQKGIPYIITCTARTVLEQIALFVQGRLSILDVNRFRFLSSLPVLGEVENIKVTWTLNSMHITNMLDKDLSNDLSRAFDYAIVKDGNQYMI